ncbi:hypothetical protein CEUSTIGMA_g7584.t1 [Chlamydomonas eustigma]|uniref:RRM domain-containing protein n=1 Tax=Chlamydomonas eustigma TaxID=1157962 RepID=A0A250XAS4_9CHLO|nr:hypothetical protein CEUSTIGMA_g7584.t1 [Chlamydomonas eustigma]|eukprot:GAX80146.1 hypothetical protein CEUSTIGMA_g7584.t1 [Chlamydomonas eustigma]
MSLSSSNSSLLGDGCTVKLKGLPFKASVDDIQSFFSSLDLKSENVFLKRHPDGRPNGEAYVVFESPAEARRATQKDRETFGEKFGDRYVRVYLLLESDMSDMQAAVQQQTMTSQLGNGIHSHADSVVKIKSLPFDATQLDVIQFFEGFKMKANGVQLVVRSDNKPTGEAFIDFETPEEAGRGIREKDHKVFSEKFGDRYVRLIQVSRKEMQATLALRFGGEGILKMKGIPFKASPTDVRKFFLGYRIRPDGISFIMHADGRPTGMAFIEFETPQEAVRAMEKDRAKFGPEYGERFCMLQLVGRHEMDKVTLQKESDTASTKLLNMTALQQAAMLASATLSNPALLMAGSHPSTWLSSLQQLGLVNSAGLPAGVAAGAPALNGAYGAGLPGVSPVTASNPLLDMAALAHLHLSNGNGHGALNGGLNGTLNGALNGTLSGGMNGGLHGGLNGALDGGGGVQNGVGSAGLGHASALNGLNLLAHNAQLPPSIPTPPPQLESNPGWISHVSDSQSVPSVNPLLFYQNGNSAWPQAEHNGFVPL